MKQEAVVSLTKLRKVHSAIYDVNTELFELGLVPIAKFVGAMEDLVKEWCMLVIGTGLSNEVFQHINGDLL